MLETDGKNNKQETAGGHWRNSALLTKDRERIQTSERERERECDRVSCHDQRERERGRER